MDTFQPNHSGSYSLVQATYVAVLVAGGGRGRPVPAFKGEVEARIQSGVLRLAGRFRRGFGWKEDRVKLPLAGIVHARVSGPRVDLWLAGAKGAPLSLDLVTAEAAGEFVEWLPAATPWPGGAQAVRPGWLARLLGR